MVRLFERALLGAEIHRGAMDQEAVALGPVTEVPREGREQAEVGIDGLHGRRIGLREVSVQQLLFLVLRGVRPFSPASLPRLRLARRKGTFVKVSARVVKHSPVPRLAEVARGSLQRQATRAQPSAGSTGLQHGGQRWTPPLLPVIFHSVGSFRGIVRSTSNSRMTMPTSLPVASLTSLMMRRTPVPARVTRPASESRA